MAIGNIPIENYVPVVKLNEGIYTEKTIETTSNLIVAGNATITGTLTAGQEVIGAETITSTSANALAVGRNGATNPVFNVDASVASAATGISVQGKAAAAGVAITATSSGADETIQIIPKGQGNVRIPIYFNGGSYFAISNQAQTQDAVRIANTGSEGTVAGAISIIRGSTTQGSLALSGAGDFTVTGTTSLITQHNVAVPAGGSSVAAIKMSSTANLGLYFGSGAPTVSAAQGSVYIRTDGSSTSTRLYVNTNGTTGWTNFTSAT